METGLEELLQSFKEETDEIFESVDMNFLFLEKDPNSDELINSIFRSIHTLKGSAGMMGMEKTNKLAHALEDVLDKIRSKELVCTPEMLNLFFGVIDCLKELVGSEMAGGAISDEYQSYIKDLKEVLSEEGGGGVSVAGTFSVDAELAAKIKEEMEKGLYVYRLDIPFDELCMMKSSGAFLVVSSLEDYGSILKVFPDIDSPVIEDASSFIMILSTDRENTDEITESAEVPGMTENAVANLMKKEDLEVKEKVREKPQEKQESGKGDSDDDENHENFFIRIPVEKIETMMSLIDELFLGKSQFSSIVSEIFHKNPSHPILKTLGDLTRNMDKLTSGIQKMVIDIRRIPIEMELLKSKRLVRDLSRSHKKEVKLLVDARDVEIDRELWKRIIKPIEMLMEISVLYSIESREKRIQSGKDGAGVIKVAASYSDSDIILEISDDGAGIPEESQECADRIKDSIKSINGKFAIIPGKKSDTGFRCRLQIPANSSKIDVFFFNIEGVTYAISAACVNEIVKLPRREIKTIKGEEVIVHRGKVVSMLKVDSPGRQFEDDVDASNGKALCIIISDNEKTVAIPVDEVIGEDEILIKKFDNTIINSEYIIGATVLGDGKVVLILNPASMILEGRLVLTNL